eukprot:354275-Chlamydomonas_euryale.AAC.7
MNAQKASGYGQRECIQAPHNTNLIEQDSARHVAYLLVLVPARQCAHASHEQAAASRNIYIRPILGCIHAQRHAPASYLGLGIRSQACLWPKSMS